MGIKLLGRTPPRRLGLGFGVRVKNLRVGVSFQPQKVSMAEIQLLGTTVFRKAGLGNGS